MTRSETFGLIALVSAIVTPLVVSAGAPASAPASVPITNVAAAAPVETAPAVTAPCARRVRVVYQGYVPPGEGCTAAR